MTAPGDSIPQFIDEDEEESANDGMQTDLKG
jgi:hypothetical protein